MNFYPKRFAVLALLVLFGGLKFCPAQQTVDLRCDYRVTPLAVDRSNPLLAWRLEGDRKGLAQTAYQIQAANTLDKLDQPDLWDSGWVTDSRSVAIEYAGKLPAAKQRVHWRVRIRDEADEILPWSKPTWFDVGLTDDSDWQGAKWISCTRKLQPEFGPQDVMGEWIAASEQTGKAASITYKFQFPVPDKHVVYAGTWWNHVARGKTELKVNGQKGLGGTEGPPKIYFKDFGFNLRRDNDVEITLTDADLSTPVSFGMQIVFTDGSEQIVQTTADWKVLVEGNKSEGKPVKVVCKYGERPLGEAIVAPRAPLAATWYKQDFSVGKDIASARLYVCGLGYNEPYLNGKKVGDHVLDPGQTDYEEFAHYQVFDVKKHLHSGENALAVLLGDGWYNNDRMFSHARFAYGKPALRAYLDIRYADGTSEKVVTSDDWRWKKSGVTMSSLFVGDYIDYRLWDSEWEQPGFSKQWKPVKNIKPLSKKLIAQDFPPIRVVREIEPIKTWQVGEKTWIVDLGQNISGWIGMEFNEPAGTVLRIRCVEMLDEQEKYLDNVPRSFWTCHASPQHHRIIADGKPHQWRPYFSYHGFRFAEIHGLSEAPKPGQIKGLVVHTDVPVVAEFKSSNATLDRIFRMGIQTHLNNMHSILEDCPQREKCLWGGDLHSSWATGYYTLDSAAFYRQQVRLFYTPPIDPLGIPGRVGVGRRSTNKTLDFTWSVSPLFLAWRNYQLNGDSQSTADHYAEILAFLKFFEKDSPHLLPRIHRYGDHAAPIGIERTPADSQLIAALNFQAASNRFAKLAKALGKSDDAKWSRDLAERIRKSIVKHYYDSEKKTFGNGTHDSLALAFGTADPSQRKDLAASLAKVYQENGKKFDGGFMSYHVYPQLAENGYVDLALEMLLNPDYPGIAQSIRDHDATTIFERFRTDSRSRQVQHSLDHHAMNHPTAWMLNYLAGIRCQPEQPGFQHFLLAPTIPTDLDWVDASVQTAFGTIRSAWKQNDGYVTWSVDVPPNCVAQVRLPDEIKDLSLDGKTWGGSQSFDLNSGRYELKWMKTETVDAQADQTDSVAELPQGFTPVFNGIDLKGWKGGDEWSVEDGALTGVADGTLKANRFIVWQGEPLKNFELQVLVRVSEKGNSGLQYRGKVRPDLGPWRVSGYQCDIVAKVPAYNGMLYEEKGRRILARNGKSVVIDADRAKIRE